MDLGEIIFSYGQINFVSEIFRIVNFLIYLNCFLDLLINYLKHKQECGQTLGKNVEKH